MLWECKLPVPVMQPLSPKPVPAANTDHKNLENREVGIRVPLLPLENF